MNIDSSTFPLVRFGYAPENPASTASVLADISELLAREQPFVFIGTGGFDQGEPDIEERRLVANWMKANKPAIVKFIRAHIHVTATDEERNQAEAFSQFFENFWGYPMLVVGNAEHAERKAGELLG